MNRVWKIAGLFLVVILLLTATVLPALAYTSYSTTKVYYYSSSGNYNYYTPGSYSTKYGRYYRPTRPSAPAVNPTQPTVPAKPPAATQPPAPTTPAPSGLSGEESKMVNLVNQERLKQGLRTLAVNPQLTNLARMKSQDMVKNNYFGHTSPTYGSPFDMMKNAGVKYTTAGENIAGAATTESAHQNLMNSAGHRANILNPSFNQVGIGIVQGSIYGNIFTQMFIGI